MEENIDVKALRARFNSKANTSDTSSRESGSPKSPRPGFGKVILPVTENRLSPTIPPPVAGPGPVRLPWAQPMAASIPPRSSVFPRPPPSPAVRASIQQTDANKVKQTGEMLQNMMLRHQRPAGIKPALPQAPGLTPAPPQAPVPAPTSNPVPLRQQSRQRSAGDVTPLRRPLPPEGPLPLKPKRPPNVNLEPFMRFSRRPALPSRKSDDSPGPTVRKMSAGVFSPPKPPERSIKPGKLQRQTTSVDIVDDPEMYYDDIGSFEKNESLSDNSSQCMDGNSDDVYESIDEEQVEENRVKVEKQKKKDAKKQREQEKKEQTERKKRENELKKNFQLEGEIEVIHTAKVRHDWNGGGKLDLNVRQGESVEILRVKNNPGGKWLARSLNGNYGYISNICVDIDYEAVKRKVLQSRKIDTSPLPPPPPDPPHMNIDNNRDSMLQDDDDYDDVQQLNEEFPPPPPEISIDPKLAKELRKKFKYEGPIRALHTMMIDPNSIIKKPGAKDLPVSNGEILEVIQLTNSKKALCRNRQGQYGYVSRTFLLPMEGDIYDDVDYHSDIYDNDSSRTDY